MTPDGLTARGWVWCAWLLDATEGRIASAKRNGWSPTVRWEGQAERYRTRLERIEARARREAGRHG